jgi:hypothetical protein
MRSVGLHLLPARVRARRKREGERVWPLVKVAHVNAPRLEHYGCPLLLHPIRLPQVAQPCPNGTDLILRDLNRHNKISTVHLYFL